jgi:hypothetical protein
VTESGTLNRPKVLNALTQSAWGRSQNGVRTGAPID